ncbi:hypothetical protein D910_10076 [Dendroctonus ponderosae]|uniref:MICOS complex subunit MIC60 n=1 Tax=Dendroctonus ponderosae TaxID=77166 RepID=U4UJU5_DENPD|nr:hypothetical protein D910_10076 [Dendroctonus ponderosae]
MLMLRVLGRLLNKGATWVRAITLAGGATLAYAKYDADFRKTLTTYLPFTEPVLDSVDSLSPAALYESTKKSILSSFSGGDDTKQLPGNQDPIPEPKEYKAGAPKPQLGPTNTKSLADLEQKICKSAEDAVNAYNKAVHVLLSYNRDIEYIIDEAVNEIKPEIWDSIRDKTRQKNECIRRAQEKADEATKDVNRLKELISSPDFDAPDNTKVIIRNNISKVQDDVETAKRALASELKHGNVTEKYWDKVEKARKNFSEELEILFPNVDISKKRLSVDHEDLDLFILHVYANVLFYQKELAKMETMLQSRVDHAVEEAKRGGLEPLTVAQICEAVEQEKRRLTACFQQQVLKLRKEAEQELCQQLKRQSQAFNDHLAEAIKMREIEIERLLSRKFDELLEEERCRFKMQISAMVGRLRGLDEGIKARNDADASSKQAQVLWSACQSLLRAIRTGCPGIAWKDQIRPLEPEINAVVRSAAPNDELVSVVINGIPKEAKERGVFPEDALRERFFKVEKVARTVDLVPSEGAPLPVHVLSYIQSLLLIKSPSPIPQAELNDEKADFSQLNTNEILQRARYWLDRGDFAQALKYMNLLKGAPRCVARQWMNETRILLETQQAATTLMAHAASSGLMIIADSKSITPIADAIFLPPVTNGDKVVCVGLNYKGHCDEQKLAYPKEPMFFSKFSSVVVGPFDNVIIPPITNQVDWEVELAVVIGRQAKAIRPDQVQDHIFGYTVAQDISARDWQKSRNNGQFLLGKSMDTFCPLGPAVVTRSKVDPSDLAIKSWVNGVLKQSGNTSELIFKIDFLVSYLSQIVTLYPGDIILTGTPAGVGVHRNPQEFLKPGDVLESEIEGIGMAYVRKLSMNAVLKDARIFDDEAWEADGITPRKKTNTKNEQCDPASNSTPITANHKTQVKCEPEDVDDIFEEKPHLMCNVKSEKRDESLEEGELEDTICETDQMDHELLKRQRLKSETSPVPVKLESDAAVDRMFDDSPYNNKLFESWKIKERTPVKNENDESGSKRSFKSAKRTMFTRKSPYKKMESDTSEKRISVKTRLGPIVDADEMETKRTKKGNTKPRKDMESDPEVLARREKQIQYGKNTIGYENYLQMVPRNQRKVDDPKTPPKYEKYSRRGWEGLIKQWRIKLHKFDPKDETP